MTPCNISFVVVDVPDPSHVLASLKTLHVQEDFNMLVCLSFIVVCLQRFCRRLEVLLVSGSSLVSAAFRGMFPGTNES